MGTQWHQEAIDALATMLGEANRRYHAGWTVARGIALLDTSAHYRDSNPYDPKPDVMVITRPLPTGDIAGISLTDAGVPLFVAEVASRSTMGNDLGFKKDVYESVGVSEYILFDATGSLIAPALHAWQLDGAAYVPWTADEDGWWHGRALDIDLRPTQPFMSIRDRDGNAIDLPSRVYEREARLQEELDATRRRLAEAEGHLSGPRGPDDADGVTRR